MSTALTDDVEPGTTDGEASPSAGGPPAPSEPVFTVSWRRLGLEAFSVAAFAWIYAALLYRLWNASLRVPLDENSDTTLIASMIKTITERGWYLSNPRLGAPFGQTFYDFPHGGETLQLGVIKIITLFVSSFGLTMNLYYLGGFGVLAAVTFLVLRHLRFGYVVAAIGAMIYTFLPYHFVHAEGHLYRSTYYSVPLACLLLVWSQSWRTRFLIDPDPSPGVKVRDNLRLKRIIGALAICVVIGATETMTTAFTAVLLLSAALISAIRWKELSRLLVSAVMVAMILGTFVAGTLPTFNYYRIHGTNKTAARRLVTEGEVYGLKLSRLVTPQGGDRIKLFSDLGEETQKDSRVPSESGQALGLLGTAGFLGALYGALTNGLRRPTGRRDLRRPDDRAALWDHAGLVTVLAVLFGTIGGFSILVSVAGFSQIRVWNRISMIIAFFALVVVASWSERLVGWVRQKSWPSRPVLGCVAVAVLAFGLFDGIPPGHPPYAQINSSWRRDATFVQAIEAQMPAGTAIFQLPVLAFPEVVPPGRMNDYDPLRGFLHDDGSLRWSYGAIKGRPNADWQVRLRDQIGPIGALPSLLGLGFTGLWVDTYGYPAGSEEIADIQGVVRVEPIRSTDGRFLFYDLRPYKARLGRSDASLAAEAKRVLKVAPPS
ncbi:MAG: hypothetical protein M3Z46_08950 [Actinomycetota bacterium]|nr:hypothetical protein [Actinomycetota bacterium]